LPGALLDYELYWSPTTDAPRVYHVACSLAVVATVLETRVYLPFGGERIYPNIWGPHPGPVVLLSKINVYRESETNAQQAVRRRDEPDSAGRVLA
jgi:hypothetical protein